MGSEMCIRDSHWTAPCTGFESAVHRLRMGMYNGQVAAGSGGPSDCLLYTSDAADERSSVDLGGRRIIKKKNQQTEGGGCSTLK